MKNNIVKMSEAMLKQKREMEEEEVHEEKGFDHAFRPVKRKSTTNFLMNFTKVKPRRQKHSSCNRGLNKKEEARTCRQAWLTNWRNSGVKCAETPNLFKRRRKLSQYDTSPSNSKGIPSKRMNKHNSVKIIRPMTQVKRSRHSIDNIPISKNGK
mmetsp:Transcript_943/g.944  ORF Transcript_943/g.944 Transcript_943/m.944 type:complete len:154 (-) Transcript_943:196-657(-)